jgi:hypothetical protein
MVTALDGNIRTELLTVHARHFSFWHLRHKPGSHYTRLNIWAGFVRGFPQSLHGCPSSNKGLANRLPPVHSTYPTSYRYHAIQTKPGLFKLGAVAPQSTIKLKWGSSKICKYLKKCICYVTDPLENNLIIKTETNVKVAIPEVLFLQLKELCLCY